jgi:hypothetical protein
VWLHNLKICDSVHLTQILRRMMLLNCIMTNVMRKSLLYLSIYFCLTCFGLSFSLSSDAGVQLWQWFKSPGYGVSVRARMELCVATLESHVFLIAITM